MNKNCACAQHAKVVQGVSHWPWNLHTKVCHAVVSFPDPDPHAGIKKRVWHTLSRFLVLLSRQFRILDYQSDSRHEIFHVTLASVIAISTPIISISRAYAANKVQSSKFSCLVGPLGHRPNSHTKSINLYSNDIGQCKQDELKKHLKSIGHDCKKRSPW